MSESWLPVPCLILTFPLAGSSAKTFTVNSWNKKRKSIHATAVASISEWKVHERHWTVFYFGQASPTSCMPSFISYYPSTWRRTVDSVPSTAAYFRGIFRDSSIHLTACLCPPSLNTAKKSSENGWAKLWKSGENALNCYFPDHLKHHRSNETAKFQIHVLTGRTEQKRRSIDFFAASCSNIGWTTDRQVWNNESYSYKVVSYFGSLVARTWNVAAFFNREQVHNTCHLATIKATTASKKLQLSVQNDIDLCQILQEALR